MTQEKIDENETFKVNNLDEYDDLRAPHIEAVIDEAHSIAHRVKERSRVKHTSGGEAVVPNDGETEVCFLILIEHITIISYRSYMSKDQTKLILKKTILVSMKHIY